MIRLSSRKNFLLIAAACALMMGYAFFAQYALHFEPCMLCMVQRVFVCAVGLVALIAGIHGAGKNGTRIYGLLAALMAVGGGYVAGRHVYLQHLPPEQLEGCAPSFEYALDNYGALQFLRTIFIRDQDCGVIDWTFLGQSMPVWVFVCFVVLFFASLVAGFRRG